MLDLSDYTLDLETLKSLSTDDNFKELIFYSVIFKNLDIRIDFIVYT